MANREAATTSATVPASSSKQKKPILGRYKIDLLLGHGKSWPRRVADCIGSLRFVKKIARARIFHFQSPAKFRAPVVGLIKACRMALFFTLSIGIIQATTNQQIGLNIITEMVIGYIYPERPLANITFKTYGYISMTQALSFFSDFKLGHYMKIPLKSMFIVQLVGIVVASSVYFSTSWWLLTLVDHICDVSSSPDGSSWTCHGDEVFYNASIVWGVIGPLRMFTSHGVYSAINWWFLVGFLLHILVYMLGRKYPEKKWIQLVNVPLILGATMSMPPTRVVNYII